MHKGKEAMGLILKEAGSSNPKIEVWELDLANYESVLSFGARVRSQLPRLDIFIANAGIEAGRFELVEGLERTLTINVVSTFLSCMAVLPKLRETSETYDTTTNLTATGSVYHIFAPDSQLDMAQDSDVFDALSDSKTADMPGRYALSKLVMHQCVAELAKLVSASPGSSKSQVVVNVVNPGWCKTEVTRNRPVSWVEHMLSALMCWTAEKGGRAMVFAAVAGKDSHGGYISECELKQQSEFMRSERGVAIQRRVWRDLLARIERISPEVASLI
ncbi:hypothetical protein AK830_g5547 [Neonectria ditissima]|uniref:Uncharacterized protein n=1 Tax=Neonectria ditissima TaxID=78410 RepID=A0A0P7AT41_9HYPO|nr:hypothetical protein AK830_g5547 [Neonectria ditissima]